MNLNAVPAEPAAVDRAHIVLNTIRRPVIMIGPDDLINYANADAEDFFRSSASILARAATGSPRSKSISSPERP